MKEHITLLRPSAPSDSGRLSAMPADLLDQVRSRVAIMAVIVIIGAGLDLVEVAGGWLYATARGSPVSSDLVENGPLYAVSAVDVAAATVLLLIARFRLLADASLLTAGLVFEVVLCFTLSLGAFWGYGGSQDTLPKLTWVVPIMVMFPLIIPGPPRTMLVGAIASALTAPGALAVLQLTRGADLPGQAYAEVLWNPGLAVAFAYLGAKVVYGLGREVAKARQLGSYHLEEKLGRGGMGEVWRARHRMLARPAAIKLIRPEILERAGERDLRGALARFELEAQATAQLRSPHTVELFDFGVSADGAFYYVMELLDGVDANTMVRRYGPMPAERCVHVLRQACHSLSEAHARGMVHRDIKPANLFLCRYGEECDFVKLLDFGLVKMMGTGDETTDLTAATAVHGTPAFIAPEQAGGSGELDGRADIYALGCVAYWLVTGSLVFDGATPMEMIAQHLHSRPVPPSTRSGIAIPAALDNLILNCLEKDPDARLANIGEVSARLEGVGGMLAPWTPERARHWWDAHGPRPAGSH